MQSMALFLQKRLGSRTRSWYNRECSFQSAGAHTLWLCESCNSLLASQNSPRIEVYRREHTTWRYTAFEAGDEIELLSLGVHFPIEEAYEDIDFAEIPSEEGEHED